MEDHSFGNKLNGYKPLYGRFLVSLLRYLLPYLLSLTFSVSDCICFLIFFFFS